MQPLIETERFYIREMLLEDEDGMFEMDTDPEVHKYIAKNPLKTKEEVRNVILFVRKQYADFGIGRWSVIDKATDEFMGWTGFKWIDELTNGHINYYDFGYRFKQSAWGKGIATETAKAALQCGIEQLNFNPIFAMTDLHNGASRHILEKIGFRYVGDFIYTGTSPWRPPGNQSATWYELHGNY